MGTKPIFNIYNTDPTNVGDLYSRVSRYFPWIEDASRRGIWFYGTPGMGRLMQKELRGATVIVGGGGLVGTDFFANAMDRLLEAKADKLILWGAGSNKHGTRSISLPGSLRGFDLVGTRDYGQGYTWVPCPSALLSEFDRHYKKNYQVVVYDHKKFPTGVANDVARHQRLTNSCRDIGKVIRFLASAETVVTSTYHGAYWATLLGCRVIVVNPFSAKFFGLRHRPVFADRHNWQLKVRDTRTYPGALEECRTANRKFAGQVKKLIGL